MENLARLDRVVHGLALVGVAMIFLGALALTQRLTAGNRLALAALVVYGFATVAILVAGTMDGFVGAALVSRLATGDPKLDFWWMLLGYNGRIVQAFASVYTAGTCAAIFLWSLEMVRTRRLSAGMGWYGLVLGPVIVLALFTGNLPLNVHGMGLVALTQSLWFVVAGCLLMRSVDVGRGGKNSASRAKTRGASEG